MENHPIPQDVTGFQFKLIGEMTLKQFAYLASGSIIAWVFFASPFYFFIKYPVAFLSATMGIGLAFLPVGGRPMDTMLFYFFRSLFAPNQFLYQKAGGALDIAIHLPKAAQKKLAPTTTSGDKLRVFLETLPQAPQNTLDEKELSFFNSLSPLFTSGPTAPQMQPEEVAAPVTPEPTKNEPKEAGTPLELAQEEAQLKEQLAAAKSQEKETHDPTAAAQAHEKVASLEEELSAVMREKAKLDEQLAQLTQRMAAQKTVEAMRAPKPADTPASQTRTIPKAMGVSAGIPIAPDVPNVVMGIVKDPRGNVLPNILVEIADKEGNPVRAFKTNNLGLFASATQMQPGEYTILFEDPQKKHRFDPFPITLTNEILLPLEIISMDEREDLRRSLFGQTV